MAGPTDRRSLASSYFFVQAIAGIAWWAWIFIAPTARLRFKPDDWSDEALLAFLLPDLLLFVIGSAAVAFAIKRRSPRAKTLALVVLGGTGYAALYCLSVACLSGQALCALVCMALATAGTCLATASLP